MKINEKNILATVILCILVSSCNLLTKSKVAGVYKGEKGFGNPEYPFIYSLVLTKNGRFDRENQFIGTYEVESDVILAHFNSITEIYKIIDKNTIKCVKSPNDGLIDVVFKKLDGVEPKIENRY